jgi:hypothetical protein
MSEEKKKYQLGKLNFRQEPFLPVFSETFDRRPWVNYGLDNQMPQYLISRYQNCAIHKAIVTSKVNQIMGDGVVSLNNPMATVNLINPKENVTDVLKKCALDLVLFGGFAVNVVWARDRETIAEIYHIDFSRVRVGKINPEVDDVEKYYYSADWSNIRKFPVEEIDPFNQNEGDASQILYYKSYCPNNSYYPHPDYSGALAAIEIDVNIKEFHANNLKNGMNPTLWINFNNGAPGPDEERVISRGIEEQFSSVNNAGRPIISFNESKETAPEITQISTSGNDGYYQAIYDDIVRSILSGHRVSSGELFAISTANKLGSKDEIVTHIEFLRKTVIMPYQDELLRVFDKLVSMKYQKPTKFEIKPLSIFVAGDVVQNSETSIADANAQKILDGINSLSPLVATKVLESMTPNEIRGLVNLPAEPEGTRIPNVSNEDVDKSEVIEASSVNENIKGMKGREYQALMRIIREYNKGKISRLQAIQMLKSGYGLSDEECDIWLGEEEND